MMNCYQAIDEQLFTLFEKYWKLVKVEMLGAPENRGVVSTDYFCIEMKHFTESRRHNTCLWEGQEGYVPVEECGTYSRETGFVPDKRRIKELNKRIWLHLPPAPRRPPCSRRSFCFRCIEFFPAFEVLLQSARCCGCWCLRKTAPQ